MTGVAPDTDYVYWLEVKQEGDQLKGLFLNRGGHAVPLAVVKIENGELVFQGFVSSRGQPPAPGGPEYRAKVEGGKLVGHHSLRSTRRPRPQRRPERPTAAPPPTTRVVNWVGVRPPTWPASNANGSHTYGKPVVLFDGSSLDAWTYIPASANPWSIEDGTMTNAYPKTPAANMVSKEKFSDFKIEAEYKLEKGSNSGIYLRGRYELQVLDDFTHTRAGAVPRSHGDLRPDRAERQSQQTGWRMAVDVGRPRRQSRHRDVERPTAARQRGHHRDHRRRARRRRARARPDPDSGRSQQSVVQEGDRDADHYGGEIGTKASGPRKALTWARGQWPRVPWDPETSTRHRH